MAIVTKTTLKSYFESGDKPTQSQFEDLIDSLAGLDTSSLASTTTAGPVRIATSAEVVEASAANLAVSPATLNARHATTAQRGLIEIATTADIDAQTSGALAITPSNIGLRTATTARRGLIEIATTAETQAGLSDTLAVTPVTLKNFSLTANLPRGYIDGFITENASADTTHDIKIRPGVAKDDNNTVDLSMSTATTKQLDAVWVSGNNQGGRPNNLPASAANTTYHVFSIRQTDGTMDAGFDTNVSANNLLAQASAYTTYRRVGSILTDASANIRQYIQDGDNFEYKKYLPTYSVVDTSVLTAIVTADIPTGFPMYAKLGITQESGSINTLIYTWIKASDLDDVTPSAANADMHLIDNGGDDTGTGIFKEVRTDVSAQFRYRTSRADNVNYTFKINTQGWVDQRGKNRN